MTHKINIHLCVGETIYSYNILACRSEGNRPFGRQSQDGRIILKRILKKQGRMVGTGLI